MVMVSSTLIRLLHHKVELTLPLVAFFLTGDGARQKILYRSGRALLLLLEELIFLMATSAHPVLCTRDRRG